MITSIHELNSKLKHDNIGSISATKMSSRNKKEMFSPSPKTQNELKGTQANYSF